MLVSLRYREYRIFWVGNASSNIGIWMLGAGRLWLMYKLTNSEMMLGLLTFASVGPILLLSMWGGVIADRVDRVRLVTVTRAMFAVTAILTGALVTFNIILPWHLLAISLCNGVLLSFDIPCRQAIVPNLIPRQHLVNAISLQSMLGSGSAILGPSLLPLMIHLWNIDGVFFFVGSAYAFTTLMFAGLKSHPLPKDSKATSPWTDLLSGFSYIRSRQVVVALISIGMVTGLFASSLPTLLPFFATDILNGDIRTYSILLLSSGIGGMTGALALASFAALRHSSFVQILTGGCLGMGFMALAGISWIPAAIAAIAIIGACSVSFGTINSTLLQSLLDDAYRGRVMSIHQIGWGASAIGGILVGVLAELVNVPFTFLLCGVITTVSIGALSIFVSRRLKAFPNVITPVMHRNDSAQ
jgi:MFS family permease